MANHAKPADSNSMFCAFPRKEFEVLAFSAMPEVKQKEKKIVNFGETLSLEVR